MTLQEVRWFKELCLSANQLMNEASSDHEAGLAIMRFLYTINPVLPPSQVFLGDVFKEATLDSSFIMYLNNRNRNLTTGQLFYHVMQKLGR